ncbi:MAG: hypothetical protein ACLFNT_06250 [Spirochaetales bacterium]
MKKLSILLIGLLLVTGVAFAQEVTIDGEASLTFGVDLDTETTGFKNDASASIELEWLGGDEEVSEVAFIRLSGWEINFESDDELTIGAPDVEAGFIIEPITITIYSAPEFKGGNAEGFDWLQDDTDDEVNEVVVALDNKNEAAAAGTVSEGEIVAVPAGEDGPTGAPSLGTDGDYDYYVVPVAADDAEDTSYQGLTITVDLGVASVDLLFASDGTWENSDNDYAVGAEVSGEVAPVSFNAGVYAGPFDEMDLGFTVGVGAEFAPVTVDLGFDGWMADEVDDLGWDLSAELSVDLDVVTLTSLTYLAQTADMAAASVDPYLAQEVVLDASGAVEGLGFTETFQILPLLVDGVDASWSSKTEVSYDLDGIEPYATFIYDYVDDTTSTIDLTVGVDFTGFVNNTVFTVEYDVDDIENSNGKAIAKATISF